MTHPNLTRYSVWQNKKNCEFYTVMEPVVIDCTNSRDGIVSVLYRQAGDIPTAPGSIFIRERAEFLEKFEPCPVVTETLNENTTE